MSGIQCWGSVEHLLYYFIWPHLERLEHITIFFARMSAISFLFYFAISFFFFFFAISVCWSFSGFKPVRTSVIRRSFKKCRYLGPIPYLLNQTLWGLGLRWSAVFGSHQAKALMVPEKSACEQKIAPWLQQPLQKSLCQIGSSCLQGMYILILRGFWVRSWPWTVLDGQHRGEERYGQIRAAA